MNDELNNALDQISDEHINEAACHKRHGFRWLGAIAAVLAVVIAWTAIWGELGSSPSITPTSPVNESPGSSIHFDSIDEIKGLIQSAERSDEELSSYLSSLSFSYYGNDFSTQQDVRNFANLLDSVTLPCHEEGFDSLYYYPSVGNVELFYDVDGIRYHFMVGTSLKQKSEGSAVIPNARIGDAVFDMYEHDQRLTGRFTHEGYTIAVTAITTDPADVDLSGFYLGKLLELPSNTPNDTTPSVPDDIQPTDPTDPPVGPVVVPLSGLVAKPVYPKMVTHPYLPDGGTWPEWYAQYDQPEGYADSLNRYFKETISSFLIDPLEKNSAYSPLNVYMALAMLAETTGGESRQQILDLLGADSIEALRTQAGYVWNAHYCADGATTSVLANSLWLDGSAARYDQDTTDTLAEDYYASVFCGDLGSDEMNESLQNWLNEQTGGLLKEYVQNEKLSADTVFALASTVYYRVKWSMGFSEKANTQDIFHGTDGDTTVTYMNDSYDGLTYYYGDSFGAVALELDDGGHMWLILPDEGYSPQELLSSGECLDMVLDGWEQKVSATVNLSLPKFDISARQDLKEKLTELGVTDVFNSSTADFTPLLGEHGNIAASGVNHAVRVAIDEEGLTAAAYTIIAAAGGMPPQPGEEIDFILDRPFLFMVTSRDQLPLFTGVVEQP